MRLVRNGRRASRVVAGVLGLALILSACGSGGSKGSAEAPGADAKPETGGIVTIDWVTNPTSLDPLKYNVFGAFNTVGLVYNTLYRWTEDGGMEPELATADPEVSDDGLTVTIPIREGVTFHDGSAFTSEDAAFTIEQVINPENASIWYAGLSPITKVEAPDDTTLVLTLSRPHSVLQGMLGQVPMISADTEYVPVETYARDMNGTGPFKFVKWTQGVEVVLERNDNYFMPDWPYLDGVVIRTVTEDAARMANLASGNSDIMPMVPFNQIETLKDRGVKVAITEKSAVMPLVFPSMNKARPTSNVDFRRAVAWAIDRGKLVDTVFKGIATPQSTVHAEGIAHWDPELGNYYGDAANLDEARAAMKKSGVPEGTKIELIVRNEPLSIAMGTVIQANLSDLGLKASLSPEESASYLPKLFAGDYDLMLLSVEAGLASGFTPTYVYSALHSESGANYTGFGDDELDRRLEAAIVETDDPDAAWRAVQERELEVVPLIPTVTARYVEAYSNRLQGHQPSSLLSLRDLDRSWVTK